MGLLTERVSKQLHRWFREGDDDSIVYLMEAENESPIFASDEALFTARKNLVNLETLKNLRKLELRRNDLTPYQQKHLAVSEAMRVDAHECSHATINGRPSERPGVLGIKIPKGENGEFDLDRSHPFYVAQYDMTSREHLEVCLAPELLDVDSISPVDATVAIKDAQQVIVDKQATIKQKAEAIGVICILTDRLATSLVNSFLSPK